MSMGEKFNNWATGAAENIGKFITWFNKAKSNVSDFKDRMVSVFQTVATFVQPAISAVASFVGQQVAKIKRFWETDGAIILQAAQNVFGGIKAVIGFVMPFVSALIKSGGHMAAITLK